MWTLKVLEEVFGVNICNVHGPVIPNHKQNSPSCPRDMLLVMILPLYWIENVSFQYVH